MIFYTYCLKDNEGNVFYIGKGTDNRMFRHVSITLGKSKARTKNPKLYNKINSILKDGGYVLPEILLESENEVLCLDKEVELIASIGLENLCNLTLGGEGTSGYKLSDETKQKMSEYWKDRPSNSLGTIRSEEFKEECRQRMLGSKINVGKTHSEETKEKMSKAKKGRTFTEEHRKKISEALKGRKKDK